MKRTLLVAAALSLGSTAALAQDPAPSFKDYVDLPKIAVTSDRTVEQNFPKGSLTNAGGPKGPATILTQSVEKTEIRQAVIPAPSFSG